MDQDRPCAVVFCGGLVGVDVEEEVGVAVGGAEGVKLNTTGGDGVCGEGGVLEEISGVEEADGV